MLSCDEFRFGFSLELSIARSGTDRESKRLDIGCDDAQQLKARNNPRSAELTMAKFNLLPIEHGDFWAIS